MDISRRTAVAGFNEFRRIHLSEGNLLFTSALHGEGTTLVATEFAISQAVKVKNEKPILFIDLNAFEQEGAEILLEQEVSSDTKGLVDVLVGKQELENSLYPTRFPWLFVLPYGNAPSDFEPLMYSPLLSELIRDKLKDYRVFIDASPIYVKGRGRFDPLEIAQMVDAVILVVLSGKTPQKVVVHCKKDIEALGGTLEGVVMNNYLLPSFLEDMSQYFVDIKRYASFLLRHL